MIDHDFDRIAVIQEMDEARATLHYLLAAADGETLRRRSNGTRWTNEELLFHMVFGYMIVRALLILVRLFGRLPVPVSRGFAAMLNFATAPFHVVNYWGSRFAALTFNHRRMGARFDRVVASLQRHLRRESAESLALSMSLPTRWDPFFTPTMTLAEVYHYPTQHFDFHRRQLSGPLAPTD
jgi:DinB superfamily